LVGYIDEEAATVAFFNGVNLKVTRLREIPVRINQTRGRENDIVLSVKK
jgi:hypothetical protein